MAQFPAGTYIFSDAAIPTGWANQIGRGGKMILGAALAGQVGTSGGAESHKHGSVTLSSVARHNHGGSQTAVTSWAGDRYGVGGTGGTAAESHSHTLTMNIANNVAHSHTVGETSSADNKVSKSILMLLRKS